MRFGRSYQLTDRALKELGEQGLSGVMLKALAGLKDTKFPSRIELSKALAGLAVAPPSKSEQKIIFKFGRRSLLGLDRLIPNRSTREWVEALIFAIVVAAVVRSFLFAPFKIPSGSMIPTIKIGDHIFATMFSFGVPVPFSDIKLFPSPIRRGDIVIFPFPLDPSVDYIKRAIALEGETVEVRGGVRVYINGKPLAEPYAYYEPAILAQIRNNGSEGPSFGPVTVPPGKFFVMGDNRFNSADSRAWVDRNGNPQPFVDVSTVKGKGQIVYWSHDPDAGLLGGYRFGRIGTMLQ
jgi:signal peptidase I